MILVLESSPAWIPELAPALAARGAEVEVEREASRTDMRAVRAAVAAHRPSAVLLSGFRAEARDSEGALDQAYAENAEAAINLAAACMEFDATAVLLSTAEVFGQRGGPFSESDTPHPASTWAESRLKGEVFLSRAARDRALILRLGTILEVEAQRYRSGVREEADDERVSPLRVEHLAQAVINLLATGVRGTVHVASGGPAATRAELLSAAAGTEISGRPGAGMTRRAPCAPAPVLLTTHLTVLLGAPLPDWRAGLHFSQSSVPNDDEVVEPIKVGTLDQDGLAVARPRLRVRCISLDSEGDGCCLAPYSNGVTVAVMQGKIALETEAEDHVLRSNACVRVPSRVSGRLVALRPSHVVIIEEGQ